MVLSVKTPETASCCEKPEAMLATGGETVRATTVAALTSSVAEALIAPHTLASLQLAVIEVWPGTILFASPLPSTVATVGLEDVQLTLEPTSCLVPSVKMPVTANC